MSDVKFALIGDVGDKGPYWFVSMAPGEKPVVTEVPEKALAHVLAIHLAGQTDKSVDRAVYEAKLVKLAEDIIEQTKLGNNFTNGTALAISNDKLAPINIFRNDFVDTLAGTDIASRLVDLGIIKA